MHRITFICLLLIIWAGNPLIGQKTPVNLSTAYYAPYGVQYGFNLGVKIPFRQWPIETAMKNNRFYRLSFYPQLSYFVYPTVQRNIFLNQEWMISRHRMDKRFFSTLSIGTGYQLAWENQGGTVNLGSGDINNKREMEHQFVPTLNVGFGVDPEQKLGWYFKAFFGRRIVFNATNETYIGAELGLLFNLSKSNK